MEMEFLAALNSKTISDKYDETYFYDIISSIKEFCQASDVFLISPYSKRKTDSDNPFASEVEINADDYVVSFAEDKAGKLILRDMQKKLENEPFFNMFLGAILANMFKNANMIEKLKSEKYIDSLLNVYNRRAYDELLAQNNFYNNIGVAFVDANGLGIVNNKYGYQKGNELLKNVTKSLTDNFRPSDIYRIGGDEFIIICSNIDRELFTEKIVDSQIDLAETEYSATYGVVYATSSNDLEELVEEASIRMKESKEKHRIDHPEQYDDKYKVKYIGKNKNS